MHIDGHHKLIRWKIVIHAGIDGYSRYAEFDLTIHRFITFLKANTNNRSDTVLSAFLESVDLYGLPSRVRGDFGVENYGICQYMEAARGSGRGSYIAGRSVHNQRIERLWKDLFERQLLYFYNLFWDLEQQGFLDVESDGDLTILQAVFLPILDAQLQRFRETWNSHSSRIMKSSPLRAFSPVIISKYLSSEYVPMDDESHYRAIPEADSLTLTMARSRNNVVVDVDETMVDLVALSQCLRALNVSNRLDDDTLNQYKAVRAFLKSHNKA